MSLEILKFSAVHQFSPKAKNFNIRQTFQKVSVKNPKNFYKESEKDEKKQTIVYKLGIIIIIKILSPDRPIIRT